MVTVVILPRLLVCSPQTYRLRFRGRKCCHMCTVYAVITCGYHYKNRSLSLRKYQIQYDIANLQADIER